MWQKSTPYSFYSWFYPPKCLGSVIFVSLQFWVGVPHGPKNTPRFLWQEVTADICLSLFPCDSSIFVFLYSKVNKNKKVSIKFKLYASLIVPIGGQRQPDKKHFFASKKWNASYPYYLEKIKVPWFKTVGSHSYLVVFKIAKLASSFKLPQFLPVRCKLLTNKPSWDLSDNVAPEEGAVDHSHRLRVPTELSRLKQDQLLLDMTLLLQLCYSD